MNLGLPGVVFIAAVVAMGLLFWLRGRRLGAAIPGGAGVRLLAAGFPRTRGKGYQVSDVDEVLDRAYDLTTTEEGRAGALDLLHGVQFGLARTGAYDPVVVDLHVDAMIVALQTGRDLPVRPGASGA